MKVAACRSGSFRPILTPAYSSLWLILHVLIRSYSISENSTLKEKANVLDALELQWQISVTMQNVKSQLDAKFSNPSELYVSKLINSYQFWHVLLTTGIAQQWWWNQTLDCRTGAFFSAVSKQYSDWKIIQTLLVYVFLSHTEIWSVTEG